MKITMTAIRETQRARFYIHKKQKYCQTFLYTQIETLFKKQDNFRYVLYTKSLTLYVTGFFMKSLNLAFILKA